MRRHLPSSKGDSRFDQKIPHLPRALRISSIAKPDQINYFGSVERLEGAHVGGFMESPGARNAKTVNIDPAYGLAKSQDAIHQMQMKLQDISGAGVSTMMAVMKQRNKAELFLKRQHAVYYERIIPL